MYLCTVFYCWYKFKKIFTRIPSGSGSGMDMIGRVFIAIGVLKHDRFFLVQSRRHSHRSTE